MYFFYYFCLNDPVIPHDTISAKYYTACRERPPGLKEHILQIPSGNFHVIVPLMRDHLFCNTTFGPTLGVVSQDRDHCTVYISWWWSDLQYFEIGFIWDQVAPQWVWSGEEYAYVRAYFQNTIVTIQFWKYRIYCGMKGGFLACWQLDRNTLVYVWRQ